jgi:hypothetical protein
MIFVYKKSSSPIAPFGMMRHGGLNNLNAGIKGKFLVLWNVDIVHREGAWHYIFEFDVRETLEISALAQMTGQHPRYPGDVDWRKWLGGDYQVITSAVREAILNMPAEDARTEAVITGMREIPAGRPIPNRDPRDAFQFDVPRNVLLALPS